MLYSSKIKTVLEVEVLEARGLDASDTNLFTGKKSSDPYVRLYFEGGESKDTQVIKGTLTPKWNEKFIFHSNNGIPLVGNEIINIDVYDYDIVTRDDFLGGIDINVATLEEQFNNPTWYDLKAKDGSKHGEILLKLRYGSPPDKQRMDDILMEGWLSIKVNLKWRRKYFMCLAAKHFSNNKDNETVLYYFDDVKAADKCWMAYKAGKISEYKGKIYIMKIGADSIIEYEEETSSKVGTNRMARAFNRAGQFTSPCKDGEFKLIINKPEGTLFKKQTFSFSAYSRWDKMAWIKILSFNKDRENESLVNTASLFDMIDPEEEENYFVEEVGLLKGRLWLKRKLYHAYYVELEKGILKWAANVHQNEKWSSLELKDVVKIEKVESNAIRIVTDMHATMVRGTKLEALIGTDDLGDGGDYMFYHKKTKIRDKWYAHINKAFNQCQLDIQAWDLLKAGKLISLRQKLEQGASAGDDNLSTPKNGLENAGEKLNMFQFAIKYLDPAVNDNSVLSGDTYLELLRLLKDHNEATVTQKMPDGQFPIHACLSRPEANFSVFKLIMDVENKIKFSQKLNSSGHTPLMVACLWRNPEAVNYIINSNPRTVAFQHQDSGWTALHFAVAENKVLEKLEGFPFDKNTSKIIQMLLQTNKEHVSQQILKPDKSAQAFTPLHEAVQRHNLDVVEMLVDAKEQVLFVPDANGNRPLHCACERVQREGKNLTIGTQKIAVFLGFRLYKKGKSSFHTANRDGKKPLDLISDPLIRADIEMEVLDLVNEDSDNSSSWFQLTPVKKPLKNPPSIDPIPQSVMNPSTEHNPKIQGRTEGFFSVFGFCCSGRPANRQKLVENLFPNPPVPVSVGSKSKYAEAQVPHEQPSAPSTPSSRPNILESNGCIGKLNRFSTADQIRLYHEEMRNRAALADDIMNSAGEVNNFGDDLIVGTQAHLELQGQIRETVDETANFVNSANEHIIKTNDYQTNGIFGSGRKSKTADVESTSVLSQSLQPATILLASALPALD